MKPLTSILWATLSFLALPQARALPPQQVAQPGTIEMRVGSGEAVAWTLGGPLLQSCAPGTASLYRPATRSDPFADQAAREQLSAYACTVSTGATGLVAGLAGRNVVFHVSAEQGSSGALLQSLGLAPGQPDLPFLAIDATSCTLRSSPPGAIREYGCSRTRLARPMFGVSEFFASEITSLDIDVSSGLNPAVAFLGGNLQRQPLVQRMLGIAVNPALYRAMQAAQGLAQDDRPSNRPTISSALVASYFSGSLGAPGDGLGWQHLIGNEDPRAGSQVNICRPAQGSGVWAAMRYRLMNGCTRDALSPVDESANDPGQMGLAGIGADRGLHVVETRGESAQEQCLATAEQRGAYAIGLLSIGRYASDLTASNWTHRFLRIDGAAPDVSQAKVGQYPLVADVSVAWDRVHVATLAPAVRQFIQGFAAQYGNPDLTPLGPPWSSGTLVSPFYGTFGGGSAASMQFTSATLQTSSCEPRAVVARVPATVQSATPRQGPPSPAQLITPAPLQPAMR